MLVADLVILNITFKYAILKELMLSLLCCFGMFFLQAQEDQLELLDLQLANYEYPYEVTTIEVHAQNQTL
ncbi:MAG TPA: hypothetical protein DEB18_11885, partial [Leeuwenhoekiella sp.]|nr:hypothetical protein [Leeuwenhoekiella sp.]